MMPVVEAPATDAPAPEAVEAPAEAPAEAQVVEEEQKPE